MKSVYPFNTVFNSGQQGAVGAGAFNALGEPTPDYFAPAGKTVLGWTGNPFYAATNCGPATGVPWCIRVPIFKSGVIGNIYWANGTGATLTNSPATVQVSVTNNGQTIAGLPGGVLTAQSSTASFNAGAGGGAFIQIAAASATPASSIIIAKYTGVSGSTFTGVTTPAGTTTTLSTNDVISQVNNGIYVYNDAGTLIGLIPVQDGVWTTGNANQSAAVTACNTQVAGASALSVVAGTWIRLGWMTTGATPATFTGFNPKSIPTNLGVGGGAAAGSARISAVLTTAGAALPDTITPGSLATNVSANPGGIPAFLITT